jgi:hypothetical protein
MQGDKKRTQCSSLEEEREDKMFREAGIMNLLPLVRSIDLPEKQPSVFERTREATSEDAAPGTTSTMFSPPKNEKIIEVAAKALEKWD